MLSSPNRIAAVKPITSLTLGPGPKGKCEEFSKSTVRGGEKNKKYCFKTYFASPHLIEAQYCVNSFAVKGEMTYAMQSVYYASLVGFA